MGVAIESFFMIGAYRSWELGDGSWELDDKSWELRVGILASLILDFELILY